VTPSSRRSWLAKQAQVWGGAALSQESGWHASVLILCHIPKDQHPRLRMVVAMAEGGATLRARLTRARDRGGAPLAGYHPRGDGVGGSGWSGVGDLPDLDLASARGIREMLGRG
jgi:hypothetical protein